MEYWQHGGKHTRSMLAFLFIFFRVETCFSLFEAEKSIECVYDLATSQREIYTLCVFVRKLLQRDNTYMDRAIPHVYMTPYCGVFGLLALVPSFLLPTLSHRLSIVCHLLYLQSLKFCSSSKIPEILRKPLFCPFYTRIWYNSKKKVQTWIHFQQTHAECVFLWCVCVFKLV